MIATQPILTELMYAPPIAFFGYWYATDTIVLEQHEHYHKNSYRNRCHILSANGVVRLSIPLCKGKHQQQSIRAVKIAYAENWQHQHWQSLQSAYGRSAFFEHYAPELQHVYEQQETYLWDFNEKVLMLLLDFLGFSKKHIRLSDQYERQPTSVHDYRNRWLPKHATKEKMQEYPQVFSDRFAFVSNLSILDLLFCMGPEAGSIIRQSYRL